MTKRNETQLAAMVAVAGMDPLEFLKLTPGSFDYLKVVAVAQAVLDQMANMRRDLANRVADGVARAFGGH